jgi:hypothetical protein
MSFYNLSDPETFPWFAFAANERMCACRYSHWLFF